jgi:predicted kinase
LLSFGGLSGTGKSTLAEAVGQRLQVPVFATDWLLGAYVRVAVGLRSREAYSELGNELMTTLALRQLRLGQSAILDSVGGPDLEPRWRALALEYGARYYAVETFCSDSTIHRQRLEGRQRQIPGWHEVPWELVERARASYQPWATAHLRLDAVQPLNENVQTLLNYLVADNQARPLAER